nr:MAG TPA: hypothetical protein [Caudoviricetes sp.]
MRNFSECGQGVDKFYHEICSKIDMVCSVIFSVT